MTDIIPRQSAFAECAKFRLTLESLSGGRVQTGTIDINGEEFTALRKRTRGIEGMKWLAQELARHLGIKESDVGIVEVTEIRGFRRFRLIAHVLGKPKESTDGMAAWRRWTNSGYEEPKKLPAYIDI